MSSRECIWHWSVRRSHAGPGCSEKGVVAATRDQWIVVAKGPGPGHESELSSPEHHDDDSDSEGDFVGRIAGVTVVGPARDQFSSGRRGNLRGAKDS